MKIIDELTKQNGKGIYHFRYGYQESPTAMMLFFHLNDLNSPNFDFASARLKHVQPEVVQFSDDKKVVWYEDSVREELFDATSTSAGTTFDVSINTLQVGDQLRNVATGDIMLVTAVAGTTITVDANATGVTTGDQFLRWGFAKTYGIYSAKRREYNDYIPYDNYVQFTSAEIDPTKTDILTNNLNRLFYPTTQDYIRDLYAEASRTIVKTMVYGVYAGQAAATAVGANTIYTAGGLEFFIPASAKNVNIKGATDKESIQLFRDQITKAHQSGISGLHAPGRMVFFCNTQMAAQIDDLFFDKIELRNDLDHFSINVKRVNLNGYKIDIVEDSILNELYPEGNVGFIVDLEGILLQNLMHDVINNDGRTVSALGASKIFVSPQDTPEIKRVMLFTNHTYCFKGISSGVFRKLIYV